jgi:hypothetical protein
MSILFHAHEEGLALVDKYPLTCPGGFVTGKSISQCGTDSFHLQLSGILQAADHIFEEDY